MRMPLVAVAGYHLDAGRVTRWDSGAYAVPDEYVSALERAGALPAVVAPASGLDPDSVLDRFDALMLVGGGDVVPALFGAGDRHAELYGENPVRDAFEIDILLAADRRGMPTLAICRGVQVMNVAFGGTLHQHLPDLPAFHEHAIPTGTTSLHEVKVSEASRLAAATGAAALRCLSAHHQGLDRLADGLEAVGWSEDGLVEAAERPDGWMVGVQWHPERTAPEDPAQQAIFDGLVAQAIGGAGAGSAGTTQKGT